MSETIVRRIEKKPEKNGKRSWKSGKNQKNFEKNIGKSGKTVEPPVWPNWLTQWPYHHWLSAGCFAPPKMRCRLIHWLWIQNYYHYPGQLKQIPLHYPSQLPDSPHCLKKGMSKKQEQTQTAKRKAKMRNCRLA